MSFAKKIGLYNGTDVEFSFSDIYDEVTFDGARFCEARVWSFFSTIMGKDWSNQYLDYAQGFNLSNRMPLWVQPPALVSVQDVMEGMRNHYEGTALDNTGKLFSDVGAGAYSLPIRNSPITWSASNHPGNTYFHERTIAQSPTGWSIVCQSRPNVPTPMAALMWFGMDDSSTAVHFPVYGSITKIPFGWSGGGPQDGVTPPLMTFSLDSAFYVFNLVANYAYSRWDVIYADVYDAIIAQENIYYDLVAKTDSIVLSKLNGNDVTGAVEYMTNFSNELGEKLLRDWFVFFGQLFVKYRDGYVTTANPKVPVCGCSTSSLKYQDQWYNRIADDTGDRYLLPSDVDVADDEDVGRLANNSKQQSNKRRVINKRDLRSFQ